METVLAYRLHAILDLSLQSSDYSLHALQGCGLGGDGPSLGGPVCLLNEDEVSSFTRQSPCTSDNMHSTVRETSSVRGPPSAFSPPLAPPLLLPPPLGPSSLLPSLLLLAPTKPAPLKPDITEAARQGEDGRRALARTPSPCTCALQTLSGSLVHCKAEPPLEHVDQLDHARWGVFGIFPHSVLISDYRMLTPHWSLAATAHEKSGIRKCLGGVVRLYKSGENVFRGYHPEGRSKL
jgi:hypothetical protein